MILPSTKKIVFDGTCVAIVLSWLLMIGLLIKRVHYSEDIPGRVIASQEIDIKTAQREWKEIYLKDQKVGYSVSLIKPFEGGYFIQDEIFLRLNLMGEGNGVYTLTQSRVDKDFLLEDFYFVMTSGAVRYQVSGKVEGDQLVIKTGKGREQRSMRIPLKVRPVIGVGLAHFFKTRPMRVGDTYSLPLFDPSSMSQKDVSIRVVAEEPIRLKRMTYDSFRLEAEMMGKKLTFWLNEDGEVLKEEGFMGLTTVKSSAALAPLDLESTEDLDLYELTAIKVDKTLPDPGTLSYIKIEVEGSDPTLLDPRLWGNGRQRFQGGVIEIFKEKRVLPVSYSLPREDYPEELNLYLDPEFNIESDDQALIDAVAEITGGDRNPLSVTRKILAWVYRSLEKRPVVSVPSALEVLRTRRGDCNEHATLLTGLLRAAGIPARISIGLVYSRKKFFYHAWTEAYIEKWVSLDATLNQMPVDVTHIKLLEGNLDKQVEIARLIGNLKLRILNYKYD
ncbi:MAG: transglutaminase domain-containing protein [Deltaproteobacteria bacterium]|nr:transglutaminase domain-containing protein [Deltaproteobacteria bacterium]